MKSLLLIPIIALAVTAGASGQCLRSYITALGVETLDAEYPVWFSPGHRSDAERIAEDLPGMRGFIHAAYGVDPDFWIALLDEEDWNELRATRPVCGLPEFGAAMLKFDLVLMPTPVEANDLFEYCTRTLDQFSPDDLEAFALATGTYPGAACYEYATTWQNLLGVQLAYRFFGAMYQEDLWWPNYVNAWMFGAAIRSQLLPKTARIDSAAAAAFRRHDMSRYGIPDVITFERNFRTWVQTDLDQLFYYFNWFSEIGYGRYEKYGNTFLPAFRDSLGNHWPVPPGGIEATSRGWTAVYDSTEKGLESILLESEDDPVELPASLALESAYPNPFNPSTTVVYSLRTAARAVLSLHDVTGRTVRQIDLGFQPAGRHQQMFDAAGLTSGVYLLRLSAGAEVRTRAVTLVR